MYKINFTKKIAALFFLSFFIFTLSAQISFAQLKELGDPLKFNPQTTIPGVFTKGQEMEMTDNDTSYIAKMIRGFYDYGIGIAGILAAIILMAGGLIWLTSAGSSDKISQAKNLISGSIIGLVLIFGSWMMLKTINPDLVDFKINSITGITGITFGGCCQTKQLGFNNQYYGIAERKESSKDCDGTWYANRAPNPDSPSPSSCVEIGCCKLEIKRALGNVINDSLNALQFPSTKQDCEDSANSGFGSYSKPTWSEDICGYANTRDCTNEENGAKCFDYNGNTILGWATGSSSCSSDGHCGYCYNGICVPTLGRTGEICGAGQNIGKCMNGGTIANKCPQENYVHVSGGRNCGDGWCCKYVSPILQ